MSTLEERLKQVVLADPDLMGILRAVRQLELPSWVVGAGAIRNLVWDHLHGHPEPTPPNDIDVAFFDPDDLSSKREQDAEGRLGDAVPNVKWDVTNQARVHLWYEEKFGYPISPLLSLDEGVATWPETATAVGVRLLWNEVLEVVAPLGLEDLFDLILRRNSRQVTQEIFVRRVEEKRFLETYPRLRLTR
jgi:hypothetical protein